jgi:hypothetical protein|nr:MAG TPA: hypothetical protein [Caudoviricetes sp.]
MVRRGGRAVSDILEDSVFDACESVSKAMGVPKDRRPSKRMRLLEERVEAYQRDVELFILLGAIALAFDAALVLLIVTGAFS